jgi:hypothetical protein
VTRYAVDETRNVLIASWSSGSGDVATTVADLSAPGTADDRRHLADTLTFLSESAWRCYTHPASAADSLEPNSEGWRRQGNREAFANVAPALAAPHLPENGSLLESYIVVEEAAHRVGRALHDLRDADLTARVVADVQEELEAIEQAELGDLSGRARQAVALSREDASPVQVNAADRLFAEHPLGTNRLFTDVDATAAAVAAAFWLQAAAEVASEVSGVDITEVVTEADNIEDLQHETPTLMLELMADGATPHEAVTALVRGALQVAEGEVPHIAALLEQVSAAVTLAREEAPDDPEIEAALLRSIRLTPLDPTRPARDLLEDLLDGIRGCWLLYRDYAEVDADNGDGGTGDDAEDDAVDREFIEAVRVVADRNRDRLL